MVLEASSYRDLSPSWCRMNGSVCGRDGRGESRQQWAFCVDEQTRTDCGLLQSWCFVVVVEISRKLWADVVEETSVRCNLPRYLLVEVYWLFVIIIADVVCYTGTLFFCTPVVISPWGSIFGRIDRLMHILYRPSTNVSVLIHDAHKTSILDKTLIDQSLASTGDQWYQSCSPPQCNDALQSSASESAGPKRSKPLGSATWHFFC